MKSQELFKKGLNLSGSKIIHSHTSEAFWAPDMKTNITNFAVAEPDCATHYPTHQSGTKVSAFRKWNASILLHLSGGATMKRKEITW